MSSLLSSKTPKTPHQLPTSRADNNRSSSPSYFGLAIDGSNGNVSSSGVRAPKTGLSPPASAIRSSAISPATTLPFHSNTNTSELDAFRQEIDRRRKGSVHDGRIHLHTADSGQDTKPPAVEAPTNVASTVEPRRQTPPSPRSKIQQEEEAGPVARSPKRMLSDFAIDHERPRRDSPASFLPTGLQDSGSPPQKKHGTEAKIPRLAGQLSMSHEDMRVPSNIAHHRSETLPDRLEPASPAFVTPQHVVNLLESRTDEILLLDLRVVTQYSKCCISGALSLCVPTTLLKRQSYTVSKLAETFTDKKQRASFERWRSYRYIITYEAACAHMKDAASSVNLIKKFVAEGWDGESCVIKGGFNDFAATFPQYVQKSPNRGEAKRAAPSLSLKPQEKGVAPVIGGCPMPATKNAANPFFGNIRQNMDLIGGVGQMPVQVPDTIQPAAHDNLPAWLKKACNRGDEGKLVADKFLEIEKREMKRMQEALSDDVTYGTPGAEPTKKIRVAGIEKGQKNRYNNIWPFEHSRVKLKDDEEERSCDYINASFVKTSFSSKNYIATQCPIPATFNDFWDMVWQRDVRVIVMLTAESEGGQKKADNYWDQKRYGRLRLKLVAEHKASLDLAKIRQHRSRPAFDRKRSSYSGSSMATPRRLDAATKTPQKDGGKDSPHSPSDDKSHVRVRNFTLAHEDRPFEPIREITQLQYASWPDFGAPAHPADLLGLVEQCDAVVRANSAGRLPYERPMVVHCSAGCGRTGTFCTADSVLDILKRRQAEPKLDVQSSAKQPTPMEVEGSGSSFFPTSTREQSSTQHIISDDIDLIEKTVEEFRRQRISMVQSLRQFVLCYETMLEWLLGREQMGKA